MLNASMPEQEMEEEKREEGQDVSKIKVKRKKNKR